MKLFFIISKNIGREFHDTFHFYIFILENTKDGDGNICFQLFTMI